MIWLRRAGAVALGGPLTAVLLVALMLLSLRGTFLNADFYTDRLEEADVYRFVIVDVLTSALDEVREREPDDIGADLRENPVATSGLSTSQITDAVHRALSPEDLEAIVAPALREIAGYATGESDEFTIDLRIGETIRGVVAELQVLMREAGVYERLLERELEPRIREAAGDTLASGADGSGWMQRLFGSDEEAGGRLAEVIIGVVTPEWFGAQVEHILDELTAYLTGESDSFEIRIRLSDAQVATAVEDLKSILREADASELVYTDVLDPAVDEGLDETVTLPYGVGISRDEVKDVLREAAPRSWVEQQADRLIEDVSAYVTGRSEGFSTEISLVGNKQDAARLLTDLAVARVDETVRDLPVCSTDADVSAAAAAESGTLPDCLPPGVSADDAVGEARSVIAEAIPPLVLDPVPDTVTYTDADLRLAVREDGGADALAALDDSRELFAEGWTYSEADLRAELSSDREVLRDFDRLRSFLADGYVHTPGDPSASGFAEALDVVHDGSNAVRGSIWFVWLFLAVVLVAIGALGGTTWPGGVAWASGSLLASAVVVLFLFWPVYEGVSGALFEQAHEEIAAQADGESASTVRLMGDKLVDLAEGAADDFAGGVRRSSFVLAAFALLALLGAIFWDRIAPVFGDPLERQDHGGL